MTRIAAIAGTLALLSSCAVDEDDPVATDVVPTPVEQAPAQVEPNLARSRLVQSYLNRPATARPLKEVQSEFAHKMHLLQEDYLPLDEQGLTNESTVIVRGIIEEVIDGRVIDFIEGASNPMVTSVFIVSVESTIKGDVAPGDRLFVDVYRAPVVSSEDLNATKPTEAVTLFLKPAHWNHDVLKYEVNDAIAGEELLKLRTPQGMWVPRGDDIEQPLSADPVFIDGEVRSQDEAEADIAAIVAAG